MSSGRSNRNVRTKAYKDRLAKLPARISELAQAAFQVFLQDPQDPRLENHPLDDTRRGNHKAGSRAISINLRYRAIYVVDGGYERLVIGSARTRTTTYSRAASNRRVLAVIPSDSPRPAPVLQTRDQAGQRVNTS